MSKSKGEFLTVSLLEEKGYNPLAYRFFCLQSHYRKQLVFSYENLDNAAIAYKKLVARIASLLDGEGEVEFINVASKGKPDPVDQIADLVERTPEIISKVKALFSKEPKETV